MAVSRDADVRVVIEDALGKTRVVRVSVPSFGHVAGLIDGSPLLATVVVHGNEAPDGLRSVPRTAFVIGTLHDSSGFAFEAGEARRSAPKGSSWGIVGVVRP